jgi:uncharacterized protein (TIGR02757 family)
LNQNLKELLEKEYRLRLNEPITLDNPDPILIAKKYNDEYISLICALFAYGKATLIVKFLNSLDFSLLDKDENSIRECLKDKYYYRFQNNEDVIQFFITLSRLKKSNSIENIFKEGFNKNQNILEGIYALIDTIQKINKYDSKGYQFLIGKLPNLKKTKGQSAYKRWNMYLRWMIRDDNIDLGLWKDIDKKNLILPLDTHTFNISQKLGLVNRKTYDLESAILITKQLQEFDPLDPIKYDFAIYRIGQEKKFDNL